MIRPALSQLVHVRIFSCSFQLIFYEYEFVSILNVLVPDEYFCFFAYETHGFQQVLSAPTRRNSVLGTA